MDFKDMKKEKENLLRLETILKKRGLLTEKSVRNNFINNEKVRYLGKIVLAIIAMVGVLTITAMAPGLLLGVEKIVRFIERQKRDNKKFPNNKNKKLLMKIKLIKTFYNLKRKKLIEWDREGDKMILRLTPKGQQNIFKDFITTIKIKSPQKWDKRWRIVIFDVPNNKNHLRDLLRRQLKNMGFYQFQKSAFIYPYHCREEIETIAEFFKLTNYITYLETDQISGVENLKDYFKHLPF